jgi:spermidine synthase
MKKALLHLIFFLSGFAALGFQLMWTRIFSIGIGNELASVLAVVSAFFGGLALGAWLLDKPIYRSGRPAYWYAALEGAIGIWGALSPLSIPLANRIIFHWTGLESPDLWRWTICFLVPFLTLLPATFCMGATLPAMERAVAALTGSHRPIPGLYSANTLGAVLGIFASVFFISPRLGYRASIWLFAGMALICSLSAFGLAKPFSPGARTASEPIHRPVRFDTVFVTLFFTGLLGIGYEIVCTRALSQFFEDSIYTYAILLMVYLLGTSLGAFLYKRFFPGADFGKTLAVLLMALGFSCLCGTALLPGVEAVDVSIWKALGQGHAAQFLGEAAAAALIFFLPTVCMGAAFSHLAQAAREKSLGLGRAFAINTFGAGLAPFLFGILLLPALGIRASLIALGFGYVFLIRPFKTMAYGLAAALLPLAAAIFLPFNPISLLPGSHLLAYREGAMASVAVVEDENGGRNLTVDNRVLLGGTQLLASERLKTHLPLLLHPHPEKALFIGLGTGITFGTVVDYKTISADGVELDPVVVEMLPRFAPFNRSPFEGKYRVYAADARRYVRAARNSYDMILADFFHPYRDGAATLYTLEHFQSIKSRLEPGGIFCQWLPLYQLDTLSFRIIVRTFLRAFPHAQAYLGNFNAEMPGLALVGSDEKRVYPSDWFAKRAIDAGLGEMLGKEGISDAFRVPSFFLASHGDLEALAGDAPLNTDDHPRVMYINPGFSKLKSFTPYGRLETLLDLCRHDPAEWAGAGQDSASRSYRESVGKVLAGRDLYLRGAIAEAKGNGDEAVAYYLRSAATSADFSVGYAKCLMMAMEQAQDNPDWSKSMLVKLQEMRPEFEDAGTVLREMFHEGGRQGD